MEKSESIKEIAVALQQFHLKVGKIVKDSENPFFKSKYASLSNILEQISGPLTECGLIFTQFPDGDDGLTTMLIHVETEQYMQATYNMRPVKNDPQSVGSAITYARRYALGSILGLNIEDDDDGNAGTGRIAKKTKSDGKKLLGKGTTHWDNVVDKISRGEMDVKGVEKHYKISKEIKEELTQLENQPA